MKKKSVNYYAVFEPGEFYHVYNRTNNKEILFRKEEDYQLFLALYTDLLEPFVHTFAYCLMQNHFHLMISIKSEFEIVKVIESIPVSERTVIQKAYLKREIEEEVSIHQIVESQFTRIFTTYAIRFNLKYKRSGNLFHRPFKRVTVKSEDHLIWLVYYIHINPMKHKVQRDFQNYPWSSFQIILSEKPTGLNRPAVLYLFGGVEWFEKFHQTDKDMPASTEGWHIEEE